MHSRIRKMLCGVAALMVLTGVSGVATAADQMATIEWPARVELGTLVSGIVTEVLVDAGTPVHKGQPLLRLDPRPWQARLALARAVTDSIRPVFDEAQREFDRTSELYERTLLSDHDLEVARIALVSAKADLARAQAEQTLAEIDLEHAVIPAPFDGIVVGRHAETGQVVVSRCEARPLLTVARPRPLLARLQVAADQLRHWPIGRVLEVVSGQQRYPARVQRVAVEPEPGGAGFSVHLRIDAGPDAGGLRPGQQVRVTTSSAGH